MSAIEWTDRTWNPVRGCTRISPGCKNCYAERFAARGLPGLKSPTTGDPFAILTPIGPRWTGKVEVIDEKVLEPLRWRAGVKVFVNSMSDLFHGAIPEPDIHLLLAVMARSKPTFQVLTKRPDRMAEVLLRYEWLTRLDRVWFGTSIENDEYLWRADALRRAPVVHRFLSLEPLLGPLPDLDLTGIDWVIVGGESGPAARPCHVEWVREIVEQVQIAGVALFVKQLGARPVLSGQPMKLREHKGGDPAEWPEWARVREFPRGMEGK